MLHVISVVGEAIEGNEYYDASTAARIPLLIIKKIVNREVP